MKRYWVYILSNRTRVLYVGVTNCLRRRVLEHKTRVNCRFTRRYNVHRLVYFETFDRASDAMARERQLKVVTRAKKLRLIEGMNPGWEDLFDSLPPC